MMGDFLDENEFGSDAPWEMMGEQQPAPLTEHSVPSLQAESFNMISDSEFLSNVATKGDPSSNGVPDDSSSYVAPSVYSVSTVPAVPVADYPSPTERHLSASAQSSRRPSAERSIEAAASNALREWEKLHEDQLEEKRTKEEEFKEGRRKEAQQQLSEWYKERDGRLQKIRQQNHVNEEQEEKLRQQRASSQLASNSPESWARICELIEVSSIGSSLVPSSSKLAMQGESKVSMSGGKNKGVQGSSVTSPGSPLPKIPVSETKDTTRMRHLLLQLKTSSTCTSNQVLNGIPGTH